MNHLDLFSGIGGFSLGLKHAKIPIKNSFFSEIDKYAIQVYQKKFKNSKYVGSVTDVRKEQLPKIDIITFGSPCQDFSMAGKRKGMDGERSSLITQAIRLINECRPSFFIWENVKGTFSSNSGSDFWAIIQAFTNIGGYRLEWQLLNTKWFLPQNRERIYLVGYIANGSGKQVFPITENNRTINELQGQQANTCTLTTRYVKSATSRGYEEAIKGDSINYSNPNSKTRRGRVGKGVAQTLDTGCNQAVIGNKLNKNQQKKLDKLNVDHSISGTLTEAIGRGGSSGEYLSMLKKNLINTGDIRRLTPIECERLQGFPDNWTQYGTEGLISDSQRYKMAGNAVSVDVVKAVGERIRKVI